MEVQGEYSVGQGRALSNNVVDDDDDDDDDDDNNTFYLLAPFKLRKVTLHKIKA